VLQRICSGKNNKDSILEREVFIVNIEVLGIIMQIGKYLAC